MTSTPGRRSSRVSRLALAGGLLTVASLTLAASPAHADADLGLSRDGVHWSDELATPLFADDVLWVPGDVRSAHFFVRNQADELGRLSVAVQRAHRDDLNADGDLDIEVRAARGAWTPVGVTGLAKIPGADDLRSDEPVLVSVRVALDPRSPNRSMMHASDLTFLVRLTDARVVAGASSSLDQGAQGVQGEAAPFVTAGTPAQGPSDELGGLLPATGNAVDEDLLWLAIMLLGVGGFLVARRRHDDGEAVNE